MGQLGDQELNRSQNRTLDEAGLDVDSSLVASEQLVDLFLSYLDQAGVSFPN